MTLADLASIGSLVSGVAVLASLIFVGFQLRQNTVQLRRSELISSMEQASAWRLAIVDNRDVSDLWVTGRTDDGVLDASDAERYSLLLEEALWMSFIIWDRSRHGLLAKDEWRRSSTDFLSDILLPRRSAAWWEGYKTRLPPEFAHDVDMAVRVTAPSPSTPSRPAR